MINCKDLNSADTVIIFRDNHVHRRRRYSVFLLLRFFYMIVQRKKDIVFSGVLQYNTDKYQCKYIMFQFIESYRH